MFKKSEPTKKGNERKAQELLIMEVSEIEEIAEKLYQKLDRRIADLKAAEHAADEKMRALESLVLRAEESVRAHDGIMEMRRREVSVLASRGLKVDEIAGIFDIPRGEVELILSLGG